MIPARARPGSPSARPGRRRSARAVPRRPDLDLPAARTLDLAADPQRPTQEVDVVGLQGGGLAETRSTTRCTTRKILLCVSIALAESASITAAVRVLRDWPGPDDIKTAAIDLIAHLTEDVPVAAGDGAAEEGTT